MAVEQAQAPRSAPSFRRHVVTIVATAGACIGAFVALFATHLWSGRSQALVSAHERAAILSRFVEDHAFRSLQSVESTAARLAERGLGTLSERDLREVLVDSALIREIAMVDAQGVIEASSEPQSIGRRFEDRTLIGDALTRRGSLILGGPLAGRRLGESVGDPRGRHLLPAAYAGADGSTLLLVAINPEYFSSLYDAVLPEHQGVARLATFGGRLIAASRGEAAAPGASLATRPPFSTLLPQRESGSFVEDSAQGDRLLSAYRVTRTFPAVVSIGLSRSAALKDWRNDAVVFGGALAAIAAAFAAGAVLLVRQSRERELQQRRVAASERAARATETRLIDAIESMSEGFALFDAADRLQVWNQQYVGCFPYLAPLLRPGLPFRDLVHAAATYARLPPERTTSWTEWRLAQHADPGAPFEQQLNDGRVALTVEKRTAEGGTVLVVRDVTDARRAEQSLRQARADAEEANRAKSDFVAMISHEIRTPMNAVMGFAELLRDGPLAAEQRRQADAIVESAARLLHLINNVLDLSRIEAGKLDVAPERFDLHGVLDEAVQTTRILVGRKPVAVRAEVSADVPRFVVGDGARLHQVLLNLLGNAAKFTEAGEIAVRAAAATAPDGGFAVRFDVSDTGPGIDVELQQRLFRPFEQSDSPEARRHGGTGLGLAISKRLVGLMGGDVRLSSAPGAGTVMTVTLPFVAAPSQVDADASAPVRVLGRALRVLVAEDAPASQDLMRAMLERRGHHVMIVGDGAQALSAIAGNRFDIALLDIQMPGLDGLETARRVRALPPPAGRMPLVALTAQAQASDRQRALAAGFDGFVTKPLQGRVLDEALAQFAEAGGPAVDPDVDPDVEQRPPAAAPEVGVDGDALAALRESVGEEALARLLRRFETDCLQRLAAVRTAALNGDIEGVRFNAHTLVGLLEQYALPALAEDARRIEDSAAAGRPVDADRVGELAVRVFAGLRSLKAAGAS